MRPAGFLLLLGALGCCSGSASAPLGGAGADTPLGASQDGVATWYAADGSGNCSFNPSSDLDVAAINTAQYAGSAACGQCVEVEGPKGAVRVRITDRCPGCPSGHLDLSEQAFGKIAPLADGKVQIRWRVVACPVTGNLAYHFKDGSSPHWTAIQIRNHRLPIGKLEWSRAGVWTELPRESYNYFVARSGLGQGQIKLRVTSSDGQALEDTLPGVEAERTVSGTAQFR